jgi:hypothetical protein
MREPSRIFPSRASAHLSGKDDGLAMVRPVLDRVESFGDLIGNDAEDPAFAILPAAAATGHAPGTADFVADLKRRLGRLIAKRAPEPKTSKNVENQPRLLYDLAKGNAAVPLLSPEDSTAKTKLF